MNDRRRLEKRLYDLATTLGMVWFWGPILGTMMGLVLVLDGRPVFFTQVRAGRGRRAFRIFKLRTMTTEDDVAARQPTRFGRFLRDRGFDELPQVLNVLNGTMSLVGPRPLTTEDADRLVAEHPPFEGRFEVPPGLTGLAQVCMARGSKQTATLDAAYARERTHVMDTRILFRTVWINLVGKRRGAADPRGAEVRLSPRRPRRGLIASTWLALLAPRRAIPISLLVGPLIYAQWTFGRGGWIPAGVGVLMCGTFVLLGPLAWRGLFPFDRQVRFKPLRLLAFALIGAVSVMLTGEIIPTILVMGPSMLTTPTSSHFVTMAMFWVGGWGLGRDIDLEESLTWERQRAEQLARQAERAQLLALRSHLDPHFLFNTLNAIAEWCREDGEVAERAVLELSAVLRTVLSGVKTQLWSFEHELELLQHVFSLHLLRDPALFTLDLDVSEEARNVQVPSMVFLPLAENAMKHGPAAGHRGRVSLAAHLDDEEVLVVTLENPGRFQGRREGGEGVAMVESRIALATDRQGTLTIGPADDEERTRAVVRLPLASLEASASWQEDA